MITIEGKIVFTELAEPARDDRAQHAASMLLMCHRLDLPRADAIERVWRDNAGALRERA